MNHSESSASLRATEEAAANEPAEQAIRRYLQFLANPESVRDDQRIAQLEAQLVGVADVVARLRLLSDIERVKQVDGAPLLDAFLQHARTWATANQVTVGAFKALGVSAVVLAEAGFDLGHGSIHDRGRASGQGARGQRRAPQAPSVSGSVVKQWMLDQPASFTIAQAIAGAGASMMTVKKAATDLVAEQRIRSLGQQVIPGVRGRAPEHFAVER